jgi:hypothetical protein
MSNKKASQQLGMDQGTAQHRLRKQFLFDLLYRHHENFCFRCEKEIENYEELSIEHKIDWLDDDPALFWEITNVTVSHWLCNINAGKTSRSGRV